MGKIIAISNQKGGVGKTTTAVHLAAGLALSHYKVLLIDIDMQGNAGRALGFEDTYQHQSIYDVLVGRKDIKEFILPTSIEGLYFVPSSQDLANADQALATVRTNRDCRLKEGLAPIKDKFDYIIIDCPPSFGIVNRNVLTAADSVIIPVPPEFFALQGLTQLLASIMFAKRHTNPNLTIEGVLITMVDARTRTSQSFGQEIREYFKDKVYKTTIPRNVKIAEAPSYAKVVYLHAPKSDGAIAYTSFVGEVIKNNGK